MRFLVVIMLMMVSLTAKAQDREAPSPLDDRGGLPVPETVEDLRNLALDFWLKFRRTNQAAYSYINEAADFRAYQYVCKRHQLNIDIEPLTLLSKKYVKEVIPAHFTEPELDIVNTLKGDAQNAFFNDMAGDVMSFEYGNRIAEQNTKIRDSGESKMTFCRDVETTYKEKYVALLATAQRRLK